MVPIGILLSSIIYSRIKSWTLSLKEGTFTLEEKKVKPFYANYSLLYLLPNSRETSLIYRQHIIRIKNIDISKFIPTSNSCKIIQFCMDGHHGSILQATHKGNWHLLTPGQHIVAQLLSKQELQREINCGQWRSSASQTAYCCIIAGSRYIQHVAQQERYMVDFPAIYYATSLLLNIIEKCQHRTEIKCNSDELAVIAMATKRNGNGQTSIRGRRDIVLEINIIRQAISSLSILLNKAGWRSGASN